MERSDLSMRVRRLGLTQAELAKRCGVSLRGLAHGLNSELWQYVVIVELLEALTYEQRREWVETKRGKDLESD